MPPVPPPVERDGVRYELLAGRDVADADPAATCIAARDAATRAPLRWVEL